MQTLVNTITFMTEHGAEILTAAVAVLVSIVALLHALIGIFMLVPGDQPEKSLQAIVDKLQSVVDFIQKFSKK